MTHETDLLVLGTGAAGLAAALTAAAAGLDVVVLEKTDRLGGTTAYSAGTCWTPGNRFAPADDVDRAREYLDALVGERSDPAMREAYLTRGPEAIAALAELGVEFLPSPAIDYHPEVDGACLAPGGRGRAMEPAPFDGRRLTRAEFDRVRPPVPEFALFGGTMMVRRPEVNRLLTLLEGSPRAAGLALRLGARWALDHARGYRRGTRLVMGNGLVANLYHQLRRRDGDVWFGATAERLLTDGDRVVGAVVTRDGDSDRARTEIRARRGVVLATGGFAASPQRRTEHLPAPTPRWTRAGEGSTGDAITLAQEVGGVLGAPCADNAFWFPSSIGTRRDRTTAVFPHIWDRAKPGIVAVGPDGRRFVDESVSYHRFVRAMYAAGAVPAWLVVDSRTLRRHGLGMVRPRLPAVLRRRYVEQGYLVSAGSVRELAGRIGVDADGLAATVAAANADAVSGVDARFGKGTSPFGRAAGDAAHHPNPNLGPIAHPPYFAIAVYPTPLGTALGLAVDPSARVLDRDGVPVPGLYACGNDAASVMGAEYPGAGCQVGAGLTFGHVAARHAAGALVTR